MATVPAVVQERWRTGQLVADAKHQQIVRVRRGYMNRLYQTLGMLDGSKPAMPIIWKGLNMHPWQGQWTLEGPWIALPEIVSTKWARSTQQDNGSSTLTVVMDNIAFVNHEGVAGLYHTIERGYFSPQKGIKVASRPALWAENSWGDVLNGGYQIELWEGYGPDGDPSVIPLDEPITQTINGRQVSSCSPPNAAITRTFVGIIDACDIDSHPDRMTITSRDFGIFLTDQRLIYRNKAPEIHSPVIFADRKTVLGEQAAGYGASASGTLTGYGAASVLPNSDNPQGWVSDSQAVATNEPWLEITLPPGAYDQFYLATEAPGQEMFIAIDAQGGCRWNGYVISDGWIGGPNAQGTMADGTPYVNHYQTVTTGGKRFNLGGELRCSEGTKLRIYLTNLTTNIYDSRGDQIAVPGYVADVWRLWGYRYGTTANAPVPVATGLDYQSPKKAQGWVLIDDVADIIRMVLMWAGFKEWDVDDFGWSIRLPFNFGQDQFFIDVITSVMKQADFVFYMKAPTDDDMSIGVPAFKRNSITRNPPVAVTVRDTDCLESLTVKWDLSDLPYSFRVRGAINKKGTTFGQDLAKRYSGTYFPPWSGIDYVKISPQQRADYNDHSERLAGLKRNYVQTQGQVISLSLNSDADCLFAAVLTAYQYALNAVNGKLQISGLPGIELNMAVVVIDEGSGTNSRIWLNSIESDHQMGESGSWHMTLSGVPLDIEDIDLIKADFAYVVFKYGMGRGG